MTEHTRRGTLQSMGTVAGNGNGHRDDDAPETEYVPRSEMKTPPGGTPLQVFLKMNQEDKNAYIHGELVAIREKQSLQESERSNREAVRKRDYERHESERDGKIIDLTVKVEAAMMDARSDRHAAQRQYGEIKLTLDGHDRAFDQLDKDVAELGRIAGDEAKRAEDRHHLLMTAIGGLKTQLADNNEDIRRVNGRVTMVDNRVDEIALGKLAQDTALEALRAEIGTVPHEVDPSTSLTDRTPEAAKKREENAKAGTGIKGQLARHDKNLITVAAKSAGWLAIGGAAGSGIIKVGEVYGAEYSALIVAGGALLGTLGVCAKRALERGRAWWAGRRIKVTAPKGPSEKS